MKEEKKQVTDDIRALPLELFEKDEQAHEDADKISRPSVTYWSDAWRRFRRNKVAMVSAIVLILIAVLAYRSTDGKQLYIR